jgi:Uma2 family endonuclease
MSSTANRRHSLVEYLEMERLSDVKHEFYDGEIFAMAGGSREHNYIYASLMRLIGNALEDGPCVNFGSDLRVRLSSGLFTYPDVTIVCDAREFAPEDRDALVNPNAVIEILSPSTAHYDTGKKFRWYQETPSIQEIVFVAQKEPRIQVFRRDGSGWKYDEAAALDKTIQLETGGVMLPLVEVYRNVEFPEAGVTSS